MAEADSKVQQQSVANEEQLKYLGFVHSAALHAILCFSNLYLYAKDKAGPLKPGVETVEGTVKTVVGPVYDKFHDFPIELLKFVDRKVSHTMVESRTKLEHHVPPVVKKVSSQAFTAAQKAPEVARSVASEVQRGGVIDTASGFAKDVYSKYEPAAKDLYTKYEPVAEHYAVAAWQSLNRLPLFPQVAQVVVPTAAYYSEKYNQTVVSTAEKGYRVANYIPLVPTDKIARVFKAADESQPLNSNGEGSAVAAH